MLPLSSASAPRYVKFAPPLVCELPKPERCITLTPYASLPSVPADPDSEVCHCVDPRESWLKFVDTMAGRVRPSGIDSPA